MFDCPFCSESRPSYDEAAKKEASKLDQSAIGWNASDHFGDDEIAGMILERPPFGSERHRFLSTILVWQKLAQILEEKIKT